MMQDDLNAAQLEIATSTATNEALVKQISETQEAHAKMNLHLGEHTDDTLSKQLRKDMSTKSARSEEQRQRLLDKMHALQTSSGRIEAENEQLKASMRSAENTSQWISNGELLIAGEELERVVA